MANSYCVRHHISRIIHVRICYRLLISSTVYRCKTYFNEYNYYPYPCTSQLAHTHVHILLSVYLGVKLLSPSNIKH